MSTSLALRESRHSPAASTCPGTVATCAPNLIALLAAQEPTLPALHWWVPLGLSFSIVDPPQLPAMIDKPVRQQEACPLANPCPCTRLD